MRELRAGVIVWIRICTATCKKKEIRLKLFCLLLKSQHIEGKNKKVRIEVGMALKALSQQFFGDPEESHESLDSEGMVNKPL